MATTSSKPSKPEDRTVAGILSSIFGTGRNSKGKNGSSDDDSDDNSSQEQEQEAKEEAEKAVAEQAENTKADIEEAAKAANKHVGSHEAAHGRPAASDEVRQAAREQLQARAEAKAQAADQAQRENAQYDAIERAVKDPNRTGDITPEIAVLAAASERRNVEAHQPANIRSRTDLPGNEVASVGNAGLREALIAADKMQSQPTGNPIHDASRGLGDPHAASANIQNSVSVSTKQPIDDVPVPASRPLTDQEQSKLADSRSIRPQEVLTPKVRSDARAKYEGFDPLAVGFTQKQIAEVRRYGKIMSDPQAQERLGNWNKANGFEEVLAPTEKMWSQIEAADIAGRSPLSVKYDQHPAVKSFVTANLREEAKRGGKAVADKRARQDYTADINMISKHVTGDRDSAKFAYAGVNPNLIDADKYEKELFEMGETLQIKNPEIREKIEAYAARKGTKGNTTYQNTYDPSKQDKSIEMNSSRLPIDSFIIDSQRGTDRMKARERVAQRNFSILDFDKDGRYADDVSTIVSVGGGLLGGPVGLAVSAAGALGTYIADETNPADRSSGNDMSNEADFVTNIGVSTLPSKIGIPMTIGKTLYDRYRNDRSRY